MDYAPRWSSRRLSAGGDSHRCGVRPMPSTGTRLRPQPGPVTGDPPAPDACPLPEVHVKVAILGCSSVTSRVAQSAAAFDGIDDLLVADLDADRAKSLGEAVGARHARFDATDPESVAAVVAGTDVVFNGVGPFYRFALPIIDAAIDAGAHYIDICDEYDVAEALVTDPVYDERAKAADVTVLTSCGSAPGMTNLMARWACDELDRADAVHVVMGLPFIPNLGPTILEHMFHSLSGEVTQFLGGEYRKVPAWGDPRTFELLAPYG